MQARAALHGVAAGLLGRKTLLPLAAPAVLAAMLVASATMCPLAARAENAGAIVASAAAPSWTELSPAQRNALAPLQSHWASMDATNRAKWLEIAQRLSQMSPTERERVQQRMSEWTQLSPQERARARMQFQESRQLTPGDRQERWEAYQNLTPEQRRALLQQREADKAQRVDRSRASETPARTPITAPVPQDRKAVSAVVVEPAHGATTTLMTTRPAPPLHQQPGMPAITATGGFVDPATLLPQRGPQGAAVVPARPPAASAPAPSRRP